MLYDIRLRIQYEYQTPTIGSRHVLHVLPASLDGQEPIASRLDLDPKPDEHAHRTDFFGNPVVDIAYRSAHDSFVLEMTARVDRQAAANAHGSCPLAALPGELAAVRSLAADAPHHFTGESSRIVLRNEFRDYAHSLVNSPDVTAFETVEIIGRALHRDMTFEPGSTQVDTPPAEAFEHRRGVCQDFTHIMIACLRVKGIPAAYVSGYLRTIPPDGMPPLEGADAMHAWVRAWCGHHAGWVEYDPTNGIFVSDQHITVAHGRDYGDVAPVCGVVRIAGNQVSRQAVDVTPIEGPE